jgi:hypothetical protein
MKYVRVCLSFQVLSESHGSPAETVLSIGRFAVHRGHPTQEPRRPLPALLGGFWRGGNEDLTGVGRAGHVFGARPVGSDVAEGESI